MRRRSARVGHPERGPFLSWLAYYGGVVEPVLICHAAGIDHPFLTAGFRGYPELSARMVRALSAGHDYLLPGGFTTVDLIMAAPFLWMRDYLPDDPNVIAWFDRVTTRDVVQKITAQDQTDVAKLP